MRLWALSFVLVAACATARPTERRDTRVYVQPVHLTPGAQYQLRARTRVVVDGVIVREQELRFGVSAQDIHTLSLSSPRDAESRWADISMVVDDAGVVRRAPVTVCPRADELDATAHAWSVIGNRTQLAALHSGGTVVMRHELSESPSEASVTVERGSGGAHLYRASGASATLRGIVIGSLVLDGTVPLSGRFSAPDADPLVGRWETIAEGSVRVTDRERGTTRTARLRVETDARIERDDAARVRLSTECETGDFDSAALVRMINRHRSSIQRCYESQLRHSPDIRGRLVVQLTIEESGLVTGVRAAEQPPGFDAVTSCVLTVVEGLRFDPGPEGGSVTYSFPFVFEPIDAPRTTE